MGYILGNKIIEFDFGEIPIIGNLRNGSVVGLSKEGVLLIDLIKKDINFGMEDISEEQLQLLDFLVNKEFVLKQDKYKSNSNEKVKWIYVNTLDNNLGFYLFPPPLTIRT